MKADNPFSMVQEIVGVIKLGNGLLGKSAIVLGILMLCVCVSVFRLHSDPAILGALGLGALFFFAWFGPIMFFANRHPAEAFLEGSQWAEHQRFQLAAKGYTPEEPAEKLMTTSPHVEISSVLIERVDKGI